MMAQNSHALSRWIFSLSYYSGSIYKSVILFLIIHCIILYNIWFLFSNRFYVSTWTHNCLRTSHVNLSKVYVPLFLCYYLNGSVSLLWVEVAATLATLSHCYLVNCVASCYHNIFYPGFTEQRGRRQGFKLFFA